MTAVTAISGKVEPEVAIERQGSKRGGEQQRLLAPVAGMQVKLARGSVGWRG